MAAGGDKSPRRLKPALQGLAPAFITIGGPQAQVDRRGRPPHMALITIGRPKADAGARRRLRGGQADCYDS